MSQSITVVGAGAIGLSTAWELSQRGFNCYRRRQERYWQRYVVGWGRHFAASESKKLF